MVAATVDRADILAFRYQRHQLDRPPDAAEPLDVDLLDLGVQDTGTGGSTWALAIRGARPSHDADLLLAWTLRGAPHAYRRADAADLIVATAPYSEADAASRVFDASKPLRASGMEVLDALRTVATEMRAIVRTPTPKGDVSSELSRRLDEPFLRFCRACNATHTYEQPFRLAAVQAGLELEPGTSPPVLRRLPRLRPAPYTHRGGEAKPAFDVIRGYLRFFGPAPVNAVAAFLDMPVAEVKANLPDDVVEVDIRGVAGKGPRFVLGGDLEKLTGAAKRSDRGVVRLVGSHDPYLQLRDRDVLVPDRSRHKQLWPTLGRPGAVLVDGEVAGLWRPRTSGQKLSIQLDAWSPIKGRTKTAVDEEAARLAAFRGATLGGVRVAGD
jgi:hypothetical protein